MDPPPFQQPQRPDPILLSHASFRSFSSIRIGCGRGTCDHDGVDHGARAAHLCRKSSSGFGATWKADHLRRSNLLVPDCRQRERPPGRGLCNHFESHGHAWPNILNISS